MTFRDYLKKIARMPEKQISFFEQWVTKYHSSKRLVEKGTSLTGFEKSLLRRYQDWQINQAVDAVKHYDFFIRQYQNPGQPGKNTRIAWNEATVFG